MADLSLIRAMQDASPEDKAAAMLLYSNATTAAEMKAISQLLISARRRQQRRTSDRATDHTRRLLVGPRLPREVAEDYRKAAQARNISLYQWASQALAAQYRRERAARKPPKRGTTTTPRRRAKPPKLPPW